ncbi:cyclic pyranopterin monophosphate synthase MoaC [Peptoniphilus sp. AGMB00490]|uniref:Cyclic pyranopterin monophosphate synthase n=1 Tax=Peptoniphilus faecalis TaxID=2731255 RepID=A0A848RMU5_9FIRM|nr:cyclic pyranopterin monophosphate synthase MoaC [Peptoniphilus faecalis]NMW85602.1 cyclic pyranopterin monophosphate synthase MoaC [Peptoniphilus faecalis]
MDLSHFDKDGRARMVEISEKDVTKRIAVAKGRIYTSREVIKKIEEGTVSKGNVLAVARVAGIMASKRTADLIPMCHTLMLTGSDIDFVINREESYVESEVSVRTVGKTGVEMEALTACSVSLLTIYDMCKAIDKNMEISNIKLIHKSGGKSGDFYRSL